MRLSLRCRCGHPRAFHRHYRPGTDCSVCYCWRFRRLGLLRWSVIS